MSEVIEHDGVVESITDTTIIVTINQRSACAGCHAHGKCTAAESKVKQVEVVRSKDNKNYCVGDRVKVIAQESTGLIAVLFTCVIPLVLMALTLVICSQFTDNDAISGTISLAILAPYLLVLWLTRNRFKAKLTFSIQPLDN
ncbi:MAG: SoxR reducing system RseC family protein [Bacteroidales bacterium]|nr:SoxR reducing system RseC family protein [Bacteroidales bacterium]